MKLKEKISMSWSGGKDCALALYKILEEGNYKVESLHTSIDYSSKKVGLHGIPEALIEEQARLLHLPLEKIYLNKTGSNSSYEEELLLFYDKLQSQNINKIISGDIFLEDLRAYKEALASRKNIKIEFPLWGIDTHSIVEDFLGLGFKTAVCAADGNIFPADIIGKIIDHEFLGRLPEGVDPCGENGEYHTFTCEGPIFNGKVDFLINGYYSEDFYFKTEDGKEVKRWFHFAEFRMP
ncbi:MAG: ATP-binding protein [Bacteroidota bacterium]|nr:ATP-binding protein [Bacteroidota bacterium]